MTKNHATSCAKGSSLAGKADRGVHRCAIHGLALEPRLRHEFGCLERPCDCLPDEIEACPQCEPVSKPEAQP